MTQIDDRKDAAVEGLSRAIALLNTTELDQAMRDRGWTSDFAALIAGTMSESRTQIEGGRVPSRMSGVYWIRLMMDSIVGEDRLSHLVYEAAEAVNQFANTSESETWPSQNDRPG